MLRKSWLEAPEDQDPGFRRLVRNILVFAIVATILSAVTVATTTDSTGRLLTVAILIVSGLVEGIALLFSIRGNILPAKLAVPIILIIAITIIARNANSIHDISILAYPLILVIATVMQGRASLFLTTPFALAAIGLLGILDMTGVITDSMAMDTGVDDIIVGMVLLATCSGVLNLFVGQLRQAIITSQTNEEAQRAANRELRDLQSGLEYRVAERTKALERQQANSEKRAQELQTIAEISRYISTEKDLRKLLPLITRIVSDRFGFYHVGIFLLDDTGKYAVLRAANSEGGQIMLGKQHRLEVGQTGIVGYVTSSGSPRIALDTGTDAVYFNNPDLPETRSEMALPLTTRGSIIGALDVQSTVPNAFSDDDVAVLSLLADQIAIAIDNAQLLEETQSSLAESQTLFNEYIAESWQKKTRTGILGYHQSLTGGRIITDTTISEFSLPQNEAEQIVEVPIQVRDQVIGVLNVRPLSKDKTLNAGELKIIQAVAERVGLALDNARLFEETSSRASRERLVTEITSRIRNTNNPQEMIKTAVEELQRALGATRVEILPQKPAPPPEV